MSDQALPTNAALCAALAKFHELLSQHVIPKDRTVKVTTRTGGSYTFDYAPLDTVLRVMRPLLADCGLSITQTIWGSEGPSPMIRTLLMHASGEGLDSYVPLVIARERDRDGNELPLTNQQMGSALTYARRYGVTLALNLATEDDDDGNLAAGNHAEPQARNPAQNAPQQAQGQKPTTRKPPKASASPAPSQEATAPSAEPPATEYRLDDERLGRVIALTDYCQNRAKVLAHYRAKALHDLSVKDADEVIRTLSARKAKEEADQAHQEELAEIADPDAGDRS